jgi:N6-adenosine-specific RNA methylase IME4
MRLNRSAETMRDRMEYNELANLFPMIPEAEASDLAADIAANGLREPIVTFEGKILDGRNRFEACKRANVEPQFVEYQGGDPLAFVVSLNLKRRHLNESQRGMVAAKIANLPAHRPDNSANLQTYSRAEAAQLLNVSERTVNTAKKVEQSAAPELIEAVDSGRVSVSAAADLVALPKEEQAQIVARGEREILQAAKEIRAKNAEKKKAERIELINRQAEEIAAGTVERPQGLFHVISIDPPWPYDDGNSADTYDPHGRRAANPYPEMSLEQIAALDIPAADDCVLWLWTTHKFMRHSFDLLDQWGFTDKAIVTWVKDRMGLGSWLRSQSEFCIMAIKGSPVITLKNQTTVLRGPLREHSRKPDEFYDMVDSLCHGRKLDFFSREARTGWYQFGNDLSKFDELAG